MADPRVQIRITAKDETAAAIQAVERKFTKMADRIGTATKVGLGLFAAGRLEAFLKQSMKAAAEADESMSKSFASVDKAFYSMQVSIGRALLGNQGILFLLTSLANILNVVGLAFTKPTEAMANFGKILGGQFLAGIAEAAVKAADILGKIPGLGPLMARIAAGAQGAAATGYKAAASGMEWRDTNIPNIARPTDYRQPGGGSQGSGGGLTEYALEQANKNLFGSLGGNKKYGPDFGLASDFEIQPGVMQDILKPFEDAARAKESWQGVTDGIAEGMGYALTSGLGAGFEAFFTTGSIQEGFKALTGVMLSGFGSLLQQFGEASLLASTLMESIKESLASFLPGGAIAASIAMIALGSALKAAAGSIFGSAGSKSYGSAGTSSTYEGGTGSDQREQLVIYLPNDAIMKSSDPAFQEFIAQAISYGQGRNISFRPA